MSASLLIAAGTILIALCIVLAVYPLLQRDMAGTVERGAKEPPDATALALLMLGAALISGVPGGWLWLAVVPA